MRSGCTGPRARESGGVGGALSLFPLPAPDPPSSAKMLVFYFTLVLLDLVMAGYLRAMAAAWRTIDLANTVSAPSSAPSSARGPRLRLGTRSGRAP